MLAPGGSQRYVDSCSGTAENQKVEAGRLPVSVVPACDLDRVAWPLLRSMIRA